MLISNFSTTQRKAHTRKVKGKTVRVKESKPITKAEQFEKTAKYNPISRAIRDWEYATRGVRHLSMSGTAIADTIRRNKHLAMQLAKEARANTPNTLENLSKKAKEISNIRKSIGI